jgi:hypothetical protein
VMQCKERATADRRGINNGEYGSFIRRHGS